jgi:hypothetical protein
VMDSPSLPVEKFGPNRGKIVIYIGFLAWLITWSMHNRQELYDSFLKEKSKTM